MSPHHVTARRTFDYQDSLKKLPIPDLEDSCRNYIEALKPLQTPNEQINTQEAVEQFLATSGPALQKELIEYAKTRQSYIEQFWYDSYLNYDSSVVLNLNPFFLLEDDPTPFASNQVNRAAALTTSSLRFIRALRLEELPPDMVRGAPLCMYQYSRLFGSARIPTNTGCVMQSDTSSRHIVVICRSQFYWFDVLDNDNNLILTEKDIAVNFESIINDATLTPINEAAKGALGVLSSENRRVWANIRDSMTNNEDSENSECLRLIDSALFVVCLDHSSPESLADLTKNMLCGISSLEMGVQVGTCTNRWYDKLQIIVTKNAKAGVNFEHTGVDGHTVLRFVSDIYTDTILRFAKSINGNSPSLWATSSPDPAKRDPTSFGDVITTPRKLEFNMTPELSSALRFAETRLADLINQNEFDCLEFDHYGMSAIKSMGFSPDAFVQQAFQAAYYALYGHVECTYEPAMTKGFLHGRTESIRSVSTESTAFVRKFCEDAPPAQKLEYLKRACEKHQEMTKRSSQGLGQDRHLYALFSIWKRYVDEEQCHSNDSDSNCSDNSSTISPNVDRFGGSSKISSKEIPSIFADAGWDKLNNTIISTSNCGNPSLKLFGFGPTSADGYGLGYIIKEDSITICASSKHRQTRRFLDTLSSCFLEIRAHFRSTSNKSSSLISKARSSERLSWLSNGVGGNSQSSVHRLGRSLHSITPRNDVGDRNSGGSSSYLLSGYGYFDVGDDSFRSRGSSPEPGYRNTGHTKKDIGRKLRLAEY